MSHMICIAKLDNSTIILPHERADIRCDEPICDLKASFCLYHWKQTRKKYQMYKQQCALFDTESIVSVTLDTITTLSQVEEQIKIWKRRYIAANLCYTLRLSFKTTFIHSSCYDDGHDMVISYYQNLVSFITSELELLHNHYSYIHTQQQQQINNNESVQLLDTRDRKLMQVQCLLEKKKKREEDKRIALLKQKRDEDQLTQELQTTSLDNNTHYMEMIATSLYLLPSILTSSSDVNNEIQSILTSVYELIRVRFHVPDVEAVEMFRLNNLFYLLKDISWQNVHLPSLFNKLVDRFKSCCNKLLGFFDPHPIIRDWKLCILYIFLSLCTHLELQSIQKILSRTNQKQLALKGVSRMIRKDKTLYSMNNDLELSIAFEFHLNSTLEFICQLMEEFKTNNTNKNQLIQISKAKIWNYVVTSQFDSSVVRLAIMMSGKHPFHNVIRSIKKKIKKKQDKLYATYVNMTRPF